MTQAHPQNTRKYIRAEKTGRPIDDFKVLFVGCLVVVFMLMGQYAYYHLSEQRWFRDVSLRTPFHSVVVTDISVSPEKEKVTIVGWMSKRRCEFSSLTGYIINDNQERHRVYVNTTPEDILTGVAGNRPPANESERWGPWEISLSYDNLTPYAWEIWAHHKCPEQSTIQSNLFAFGLWRELHVGKGN